MDPFATVYGQEWFRDLDANLVITDEGVFPLLPLDVQYLYPDGDILSGGWETAPTPGQALNVQIDEDPPVDTDYIFEDV